MALLKGGNVIVKTCRILSFAVWMWKNKGKESRDENQPIASASLKASLIWRVKTSIFKHSMKLSLTLNSSTESLLLFHVLSFVGSTDKPNRTQVHACAVLIYFFILFFFARWRTQRWASESFMDVFRLGWSWNPHTQRRRKRKGKRGWKGWGGCVAMQPDCSVSEHPLWYDLMQRYTHTYTCRKSCNLLMNSKLPDLYVALQNMWKQ